METREAIEARVSGRVQGVGFRWHTRETARAAGLRGWVRNEADGTVTLRAEGSPDGLRSLREFLARGPRGARVDGLDIESVPPRGEDEGFEVRS
ncbi:MAG: acylphosphatase [Planctomycetota bacterium]